MTNAELQQAWKSSKKLNGYKPNITNDFRTMMSRKKKPNINLSKISVEAIRNWKPSEVSYVREKEIEKQVEQETLANEIKNENGINTEKNTMTRADFETLEKENPKMAMDFCTNGGKIEG